MSTRLNESHRCSSGPTPPLCESPGSTTGPAFTPLRSCGRSATLGGLYLCGRRLFDVETGIAAALLYSVFQPWGTWKNLALNGEVLMNLPLAWAWAIAFGRISQSCRRFRTELALAGALVAMALLLKQPAAIAALPMAVYLSLPAYRQARGYRWQDSALQVGLFITGLAATLGAVVAVLYAQQTLGEAFYWTVLDHDVPIVFWTRGALHTVAFLAACLPLCAAATAVIRNQELWKERRAERAALLAWLAVSVLGTLASGRFYPHYYIQLVLPLSLLAAPAFARMMQGATLRLAAADMGGILADGHRLRIRGSSLVGPPSDKPSRRRRDGRSLPAHCPTTGFSCGDRRRRFTSTPGGARRRATSPPFR